MATRDNPLERPPVVFLTGANGFVGSHLARALIADGCCVRALVRPSADRSRITDLDIEWIIGDLDDHHALRQGCDGARWVVHSAGRVKAPNADAYMHANATGTRNLVAAALAADPRPERFVYVSSLAAGGPSRSGHPRTEDDPPAPVTPYGESKLAGEREVLTVAAPLPVTIVRPPVVYGPSDTEVLGFFKAVRWHLKPTFGKRPQRLSIVHVADLVAGIRLAMRVPVPSGEIFYVADDQVYTLAELENMIQAALGTWAVRLPVPRPLLMTIAWTAHVIGRIGGFTPRLNPGKARDFLQVDWTCSTAKANRLLGYRSHVPFAVGARETIAWYREQGWL